MKMRDREVKAMLAKLVRDIEGLNAKVSEMPQVQIQVSSRLLPTLWALQKIESGTATQVSAVTLRCRAFESKNLNELHMLGVVSKEHLGHEKIFRVKVPLS
jgi:hypothetical protein